MSLVRQIRILFFQKHRVYHNNVEGCSVNFIGGMTTNVYTPSSSNTVSGNFIKHNFNNGITSYYSLSMSESAFPNNISYPDTIIGTDEREPETSSIYTGIVYLGDYYDGATGFVVGDHLIATAAHCVYDSNGWTNKPYLYFPTVFSDGTIGADTTGQKHYFKEAHIDQEYAQRVGNSFTNSPYDYALITVSENLSGRYHFNLGIPYDMYNSSNLFEDYDIYVTGYPGDHASNNVCYLYTGVGNLYTGGDALPNMLCYTTDTYWGDSGSPVYIKENVQTPTFYNEIITVIAIHKGINNNPDPNYPYITSNWGALITPLRLKFFLNNPNISY